MSRVRLLESLPVVLAVVVGTTLVVEFVAPYAAVRTGLGSGYQVGVLRWGRAEFAHWWEREHTRQKPHRVGVVYAPAGDRLKLQWDADLRTGAPALRVTTFPAHQSIWRREFSAEDQKGEAEMELQGSSLYWISLSKRGWTGRVKVRWNVQ